MHREGTLINTLQQALARFYDLIGTRRDRRSAGAEAQDTHEG